MRHRKTGRQFSRNSSHRRAMLRLLTANLVAHERIETTEAKAKELRRVAERMITRARRLGPVAYTPHDKLSIADRARRQAAQRQMARFLRRFAVVGQGDAQQKIDLVEKVFVDLAKRFKDRSGGYTRIMKLGRRRGDNAPMTLIEFVDGKQADPSKAQGKAAAAAAKPAEDAKATEKPAASKPAPPKAEAADEKTDKGETTAAKAEAKTAAEEAKAEGEASTSKAAAASRGPAKPAGDEPKKPGKSAAAKKAPKK